MFAKKATSVLLGIFFISGCSTYQPRAIIPVINHTNNQQKVEKEKETDSDKVASVLEESIATIQKLSGESFSAVEENNIYQFTVSAANGADDSIVFDPNKNISIKVKSPNGSEPLDVPPLVGRDAFEHMKKRLGPGASSNVLSVLHLLAAATTGNTSAAANHEDTKIEKAELAEQLAYLSGKKALETSTLEYGETTTGVLVVDLKTAPGNVFEISIQIGDDTHIFRYCRSKEGLYCYTDQDS